MTGIILAAGIPVRVIDDGTESNETRLGAVKDIQLAADLFFGLSGEL